MLSPLSSANLLLFDDYEKYQHLMAISRVVKSILNFMMLFVKSSHVKVGPDDLLRSHPSWAVL